MAICKGLSHCVESSPRLSHVRLITFCLHDTFWSFDGEVPIINIGRFPVSSDNFAMYIKNSILTEMFFRLHTGTKHSCSTMMECVKIARSPAP